MDKAPPTWGVDEDWSKADVQLLVQQGFTFVIGYVSEDTTGKNLAQHDVDVIDGAGLAIVLVYEYAVRGYREGFSRGLRDGAVATIRAQRLGAPLSACIYYAIDEDPAVVDYSALSFYLAGVRASHAGAGYRIGVYGGFGTVEWLAGRNSDVLFWQTYAWSRGQWSDAAGLRQVENGVHVGTAVVDKDQAVSRDFGQWRPYGHPISGGNMGIELSTIVPGSAFGRAAGDRTVGDILHDMAWMRAVVFTGDVAPLDGTPLALWAAGLADQGKTTEALVKLGTAVQAIADHLGGIPAGDDNGNIDAEAELSLKRIADALDRAIPMPVETSDQPGATVPPAPPVQPDSQS